MVRAGQAAGQWMMVGVAVVVFAGLRLGDCANLAAGRAVYAVGSDAEAARLAGIRPAASSSASSS